MEPNFSDYSCQVILSLQRSDLRKFIPPLVSIFSHEKMIEDRSFLSCWCLLVFQYQRFFLIEVIRVNDCQFIYFITITRLLQLWRYGVTIKQTSPFHLFICFSPNCKTKFKSRCGPEMAKECETFLISHVAMIVGKQVALNPFLEFQVRIDEFNHKFVFEYNLAV